jgi:two-component system, NarL family, nitrate/nitrite response regulator NarL
VPAGRPTTGVFIVADVRLYREGLAGKLSSSPGLVVIGTSASRADAREQAGILRPDVILIDVATSESLELIHDLRAEGHSSKILAFAVADGSADILECAEAGAAGYVTAEASIEDLVTAIERITRAELACSPRVAAQLFNRIAERRDQWAGHPLHATSLTTREHQVLNGISKGHSNKEIGQTLNIAESTVKNHVHHVLEKLHVTTRAQAAARCTSAFTRRQPFGTRAIS